VTENPSVEVSPLRIRSLHMPSLLLRLSSYDQRLLFALVHRRRPGLDRFMRAVTHLADWPVAVSITLAMALGAVEGLESTGIRMAWTLGLSHLGVEILKRVFTRERPRLPVGLEWMVGVPDRFSFPSGHATAGMAMGLPLVLSLGWPVGVVIAGLAVSIGLSRCYLGVHYPGDVLAGWALAITTLTGVIALGF
jgi:undecaprenyl-diphosphatase